VVWMIQGKSTVTEVVVLGHDVDMEYCWSSVDGRGRRESTFLQLLRPRLAARKSIAISSGCQ
jgi:hypothetical protein